MYTRVSMLPFQWLKEIVNYYLSGIRVLRRFLSIVPIRGRRFSFDLWTCRRQFVTRSFKFCSFKRGKSKKFMTQAKNTLVLFLLVSLNSSFHVSGFCQWKKVHCLKYA